MKYLQAATAIAAFAILLPASCFAALGGDVNSVLSDQEQMKAQRRVTQMSAYSVHEMKSQAGMTVREFVSPEGKVFGVAWQGQTLPNFQQVLGTYYDQFIKNAPRQRAHGPVTIHMPGLVVQSGGHMRALTGRAYVPEMMPSGVKADDIK
jgi:hypothetical protein